MSISSQSESAQVHGKDGDDRRSLRLLVVDDDATQRMLISTVARQAGHSVTSAQSCLEAIGQIQTTRFDCVTLDLTLGDGDGVEVLTAMADAKFTGSVIIISGMNAARRLAAGSYVRSLDIELQSLPKPLNLAALRVCFVNLRKTATGLPVVHEAESETIAQPRSAGSKRELKQKMAGILIHLAESGSSRQPRPIPDSQYRYPAPPMRRTGARSHAAGPFG